jgi:hypothetical protein
MLHPKQIMGYSLIFHRYTFVFIVMLTLGCGPAHKVTSSWTNKDFKPDLKYKKIYVAALVNNPHVRTHLEEDMSTAAKVYGFTVERSWDYFPPTFGSKQTPEREIMMDKIKQLNCELIFSITLVEKESETRYIPRSMGYYGPFHGYGLHFWGFYSYWHPYMYDPGYYVTDKIYFMEGNLFDVSSETLIWSVQTKTLNPPSIEKFSKGLVETMLRKALTDLNQR